MLSTLVGEVFVGFRVKVERMFFAYFLWVSLDNHSHVIHCGSKTEPKHNRQMFTLADAVKPLGWFVFTACTVHHFCGGLFPVPLKKNRSHLAILLGRRTHKGSHTKPSFSRSSRLFWILFSRWPGDKWPGSRWSSDAGVHMATQYYQHLPTFDSSLSRKW